MGSAPGPGLEGHTTVPENLPGRVQLLFYLPQLIFWGAIGYGEYRKHKKVAKDFLIACVGVAPSSVALSNLATEAALQEQSWLPLESTKRRPWLS